MGYGYGGYDSRNDYRFGNFGQPQYLSGQGFDSGDLQGGFSLGQTVPTAPPIGPVQPRSLAAPIGGRIAAPGNPYAGGPSLGDRAASAAGSFAAGGPLGLGVNIAGRALSYLGGGAQRAYEAEQRNNAKWAWNKAKQAYGTDVINPGQTMWASRAAMIPRMNQLGAGLDKKYGFDSGRGGGMLGEAQLSAEAQAWLDAYLQNAQLKQSRDTNILGYLGG